MAAWILENGELCLGGAPPRTPPTADDIFRSIVENEQRWPDVPPGKSGAAAGLTFSRYPAIPHILLYEEAGQARLRFEANLPDGSRIRLSPAALRAGHVVADAAWFPLEPDACTTVAELAARSGAPDGGHIPSFREVLNLKKRRASGDVEDHLELDAAQAMRMAPLPDGQPQRICGTLYPYQSDGWRWLRFINSDGLGGLLADEMGLGKTLQVIALLSDPGMAASAPALIVAPGSLLENWCREVRKFAPELSVHKHHGPNRTGSPSGLDHYDVVVTSYETVVRDGAVMGMRHWAIVVLDEAQNIKNPDATRTRAVKRLARTTSIAVTGTPLENRLLDVWSIMDFVCPGYLGSENEFTRSYVDSPDAAGSLEPIISPLILRRKVAEVARDLPPRIEVPQILELDPAAASQYDALRKSIYEDYGRSATLVALTKLRMFCAHPDLVSGPGSAPDYVKMQRLTEIAEEIFATGEKVIVFTSYTEMADMIETHLANSFGVFAETLDGRTPIDNRQPMIDRFSAAVGGAVLVLNPRAGGAGLNITAANHVVHYNPEWNPALEDQASARSHRRGQTRPVTIHRLLIAGTVEEAIAERLQRKRALATSAIVGVEGEADDLADIVSALGRSPLARGA